MKFCTLRFHSFSRFCEELSAENISQRGVADQSRYHCFDIQEAVFFQMPCVSVDSLARFMS